MKKLKLLLGLVLLALPALAQTHTSPNLDSNNVFTGTNQFTQGVFVGTVTFSQLPSLIGVTNLVYVSNATANSNPCTGGGTGAMASYINGAWNCGASGGGSGTITGVNTNAGSGLTGGGTSGTLTLSLLTSCSVNQILQWNGSAWACATVSGATAVTSFSGDGALLSNSASTGAVVATLTTAGAHKWWGNNTGSTATPAYLSLSVADIPTLNQNTTGNAATATALAATPSLCTTGQAPTGVLANGNATGCASIAGGGSVSSVGLTQTGSIFTITNTPITTTGNINIAFASATANQFFAAPNGAPGAPSFRAIVSADIPTLNQNTTGSAASFTGSLSGDVTGSQSSTVVGKINGILMSGLATGILKNTTSTGVPSIAIAADFPLLNQNTSGTAANLSGTPALPNGTTATTQTVGDNTTKIATDAFVLANSGGSFTNPMTTLGDIIYQGASVATRLAGPNSPNGIPQTLISTPSSSTATAPAWAIPGVPIDTQTGTSYTIPIVDDVSLLTISNALPVALAGTNMLANNYAFATYNLGAGLGTYTAASGTVNGSGGTAIIPQWWFGFTYTDNTNTIMPIMPTLKAFPNCTDTGGNHINFTAATGALSCGTSSSGVTSVTGTAAQITVTGTTAPTLSIPSTFTFPGTVTNNLSIFGATTSAQLLGVLSDETGTGKATFATSPAFLGTPDASGATQFKLPVAAGFASLANGELGYDTTNSNWHVWGNAVDNINAVIPASITPANNDCAKWTVAAGVITLNTAGAACGSGGGVTNIATTSPIGGGPITTTGTLTCTTCVVGSGTQHGVMVWGSGQTPSSTIVGAANAMLVGATSADPIYRSFADISKTAYAVGAGTAQVQTATYAPALNANAAGEEVKWLPVAANTTAAPTLNINGNGALNITKCGTVALVANDLNTTTVAIAVNDGTQFQLLNPQAVPCSRFVTGTASLGTGAITSATCATVVTVAGTGIVTTDVINWDFNGDPTAVTGYVPATAGMLTIIAYPTAGNANFKVCNNTTSSVTPGAITLNWHN